jgi:hypothetical protein
MMENVYRPPRVDPACPALCISRVDVGTIANRIGTYTHLLKEMQMGGQWIR